MLIAVGAGSGNAATPGKKHRRRGKKNRRVRTDENRPDDLCDLQNLNNNRSPPPILPTYAPNTHRSPPESTHLPPPESSRTHPSAPPESSRTHPSAPPESSRTHPSAPPESSKIHPSAFPESPRVHPSAPPESSRAISRKLSCMYTRCP
ncbi:uncharacterized protein LKV04_012836 isoform 2-T2 [Tautogolabrus adspersus]